MGEIGAKIENLDKILRAMLLNIRRRENRRFFPKKLSMISLQLG